ncbi:MAG: hypothetical protein J6K81_07340 [Rikenellaceae bacterium]|nr:hypothetical protein [Rikenellaceae bacterium]
MKRIFTTILSLALVSASFIGCETETPEAVEKTLGKTTIAVEEVGAATQVFYYGVEKSYKLEHEIIGAAVTAPEGWTATYDEATNTLTVTLPASGGAKQGAVVIKGTDALEREATATLNVSVREKDAVDFADVAFRNYLAANFAGEDGVLSSDEIAAIKVVDLRGKEMAPNFRYEGMGVTSLAGIEQLTGLTELYISNNKVGSVDLSKNTKLTKVHAYFCDLAALDLSKNTELTEVLCFYNKLATLDLSKNTKLTKVYCQNNALTEVKLPANSAITDLNVSNNQLTALDAAAYKSVVTLNVSGNALAALDITACAALTELNAEGNKLESIDLSKASKLTSLNLTSNMLTALDLNGCSELTELNAAKNMLAAVDLGGCPKLESANVGENAITSLTMTALDKLTYLGCWNNALQTLDLSGCPNLERLIANNNNLAAIDLSTVKKVAYAKVYNNPFESLILDGCEALEYLDLLAADADPYGEGNIRYARDNKGKIVGPRQFFLTGMKDQVSLSLSLNDVKDVDPQGFREEAGNITEMVVFDNKKLAALNVADFTQMTYLDAHGNALTSIDVKANTELTKLLVNGNKIESVDVEGLNKLTVLNVSDMATLSALNIAGATKTLTELYITSANSLKKGSLSIQGSALKALNLNTKGTDITTVTISGNEKLTTLDLANCPQVTTLQVQNNELLGSLDVSAMTDLSILAANGNDLTEINLSANAKIGTLNLSDNRIANVDLSNIVSLSDLNITNNYVAVLDLSANEKVSSVKCTNNFNLVNIYMAASLEGNTKVKIEKDDKAVVTYGAPVVE